MTQKDPALGVCYYPEQWPEDQWVNDAAKMTEMGLSWVRIGEFAWSRIEPKEGHFDWGWLDRAIETLGATGLKVMLGTPTATPPRWVLTKYPDMLAVDSEGRTRKFGSRRHYCFSHAGYRGEAARITRELAQRFGTNPHVQAWQTDNEYGCHDTTISYSDAARSAFQIWLDKKYQTIGKLNSAWGNVFWSMDYAAFSEVDLPNLTVTEPNPSHVLDFRRFSSDQVVSFNHEQARILREETQAPLIHNYMGGITDFDHYDVGADLDIASWDSYPLGFLEDRVPATEGRRASYMRQGDPDYQAFHHDLYRAVGRGRWGIMEQQPGPVNWAPYNPAPFPGMVRVWTWEAIAHGAEFVNFFRWRQAPFAQEQMHAGLLRSDGELATGAREVMTVARELTALSPTKTETADIGLVFDYTSQWAWETQPQGRNFSYAELVFDFYRALRKLGLSVDIISPTCNDFGDRKLVIIPGLFCWTETLHAAIEAFSGRIVIGPRSGSKTPDFGIPKALPPNLPKLSTKVAYSESLRPGSHLALEEGGYIQNWMETLETNARTVETLETGEPVMVQANNISYLAGWPDEGALKRILSNILSESDVETMDMPAGLRVRDFGRYRLFTNYSLEPVFVPHTLHTLKVEAASILLIDQISHKVFAH